MATFNDIELFHVYLYIYILLPNLFAKIINIIIIVIRTVMATFYDD